MSRNEQHGYQTMPTAFCRSCGGLKGARRLWGRRIHKRVPGWYPFGRCFSSRMAATLVPVLWTVTFPVSVSPRLRSELGRGWGNRAVEWPTTSLHYNGSMRPLIYVVAAIAWIHEWERNYAGVVAGMSFQALLLPASISHSRQIASSKIASYFVFIWAEYCP